MDFMTISTSHIYIFNIYVCFAKVAVGQSQGQARAQGQGQARYLFGPWAAPLAQMYEQKQKLHVKAIWQKMIVHIS